MCIHKPLGLSGRSHRDGCPQQHVQRRGISIHWHGLHQKNMPYMDGLSLITQCPIAPQSTFRYDFTVENAGPNWFTLDSIGQTGPLYLIVRQADDDSFLS